MGFTHWLVIQQADLTFRFVSEARYVEFWNGRGALPQMQPGEVRVVQIALHLEQPAASEVLHVEYRRFPVAASGRRDEASTNSEMGLVRDVMGLSDATVADAARRQWAKQQIECNYRWTPTVTEEKEIADMVSRRARQSLLGGSPFRLLKPRRTATAQTPRRVSPAPPPLHRRPFLL